MDLVLVHGKASTAAASVVLIVALGSLLSNPQGVLTSRAEGGVEGPQRLSPTDFNFTCETAFFARECCRSTPKRPPLGIGVFGACLRW